MGSVDPQLLGSTMIPIQQGKANETGGKHSLLGCTQCKEGILESEIARSGRSERGRCANLSQIARQTCAKLQVFRFVHHTKGVQICRKLAPIRRTILDNFMQIPLFQCPLLEILIEGSRGCFREGSKKGS